MEEGEALGLDGLEPVLQKFVVGPHPDRPLGRVEAVAPGASKLAVVNAFLLEPRLWSNSPEATGPI